MTTTRRVLFLLCAGGYCVLGPLLVRHVLELLGTGMITVRTVPAGASLALADQPLGAATPWTIRALTPGQYELSLSAPGYRTWTQTVVVRGGEVTRLDGVLLLPTELETKSLGEAAFERIVSLQGVPLALLEPRDPGEPWQVIDLENVELRPVWPDDSPWSKARIEEAVTIPGSAQVLMRAELRGETRYVRIKLHGQPHRIEDVSEHFPERPDRVLWEASFEDVLFVVRGGDVRKVDLSNGSADPAYGTAWRGMGVFQSQVYSMDKALRIESMNFDKSSEETIFDDAKAAGEIFGEGRNWFAILPFDNEAILFLGDDGRLCQSGLPNLLVAEGVRGVRVDGEAGRALLWTARKLGVLEPQRGGHPEPTPASFKKGRQVSWVFEHARDLTEAWFVNGGAQALILDDRALYLVDLFPGVRARPRELASARKDGGLCYDHRGGLAYVLAPGSGRLISIRVAPPAPAPPPLVSEDLP